MKKVLLLLVLVSLHQLVQAQRLKWRRLMPTKMLELGVTPTAYRGDLEKSYRNWSAGVSMSVLFNKNEKLNGSISLDIQTFTGQRISQEPFPFNQEDIYPNTFFRGSSVSANYNLRYHFIKTDYVHVYVGQGIGLFRFSSKDSEGTLLQNQILTRNFDESYSNTTFVLPTRVGGIFFLRNGYGIGLQATLHNVLTDYLDNISQLGEDNGNDNLLSFKAALYVPLSFYQPKKRRR